MNENAKYLIKTIVENAGVNCQSLGMNIPDEKEKELIMYLVSKEQGTKEFKVNEILTLLMNRKSYGVAYGTTTKNNDKIGVVLTWE